MMVTPMDVANGYRDFTGDSDCVEETVVSDPSLWTVEESDMNHGSVDSNL